MVSAGSGTRHRLAIGLASFFTGLAAIGAPAPAPAQTLQATVRSQDGDPVKDAVVYATAVGATIPSRPGPAPIVIDQVNKEYVPYVTALQVGAKVSFPNRDQIRHHVYSFSEAKTFEIPLYAGTPVDPVEFDKAGEVVLGCNIHDWMKAYVFVSETPYFAVTDEEGRARIELPPGEYDVEVWHPEQKGDPEDSRQRLSVSEGDAPEVRFAIERKRVWRARRAPSMDGPTYR